MHTRFIPVLKVFPLLGQLGLQHRVEVGWGCQGWGGTYPSRSAPKTNTPAPRAQGMLRMAPWPACAGQGFGSVGPRAARSCNSGFRTRSRDSTSRSSPHNQRVCFVRQACHLRVKLRQFDPWLCLPTVGARSVPHWRQYASRYPFTRAHMLHGNPNQSPKIPTRSSCEACRQAP